MKKTDMTRRIQSLFSMARENPGYEALRCEFAEREVDFDNLVSKLTEEEQDTAWGYICLSEDLNWYLLELICDRYDIDPDR